MIMFEWFPFGVTNILEKHDTDLIENWNVKSPSGEIIYYFLFFIRSLTKHIT